MPRTAHNCTRLNLTTFLSVWRCDLLSRKWTVIMVSDMLPVSYMQGASRLFRLRVQSIFILLYEDQTTKIKQNTCVNKCLLLTSIFYDTPIYLLLVAGYIISYIWYVSKQLQKLHSAMLEIVIELGISTVCQGLWKSLRFAQVRHNVQAQDTV